MVFSQFGWTQLVSNLHLKHYQCDVKEAFQYTFFIEICCYLKG
jgi:hypothetical protein